MLAAFFGAKAGFPTAAFLGRSSVTLLPQVDQTQKANFAKGAAKPAAKTQTKAGKKAQDPGTADSATQKFLAALQPQTIVDLQLSSEEQAENEKRAKEYSRKKMAQHRFVQALALCCTFLCL